MKKYLKICLMAMCVLMLTACGKKEKYNIEILVPAGSTEAFVYSDEEINPIGNKVKIWAGAGLSDTEVILKPVTENIETGYVAEYLTHGAPVEFDVDNEKDQWFKIGVSVQNDSDRGPIAVSVEVEDVEVRIAERDEVTFEATILEVHDGYYFAKPVSGSRELNSADKIEVSTKNLDSSEPKVGDVIEITYDGIIMENYPARLHEVYDIKVVEEVVVGGDLIPMVMVNGELYLDTGIESGLKERCGMMDGKITSEVARSEKPIKDEQSNFGTGYGYQYGSQEGAIEININGKWWIFATEEARKQIKFSIHDEVITFHDKTFNKSDLSQETIEWLDWYNGLSEDEQLAISYIPAELYEICGYPTAEVFETEAITNDFEEKYGITLTADHITPTGMVVCCSQSGGEPTGELQTGGWYIIEKWSEENGWEESPYVIDGEIGWTSEAWLIMKSEVVEWNVNWEWLYGKLPVGEYRIGKQIMDWRAPGDYDTAVCYIPFEIN